MIQFVISASVAAPKTVTTRKVQQFDVAVNEDEPCLPGPIIKDMMMQEFPPDKLRDRMDAEMTSVTSFDTHTLNYFEWTFREHN